MLDRTTKEGLSVPVRLVQFTIFPEDEDASTPSVELHIVLFPEHAFPYAKQFWQHTGLCVSSRLSSLSVQLASVHATSDRSSAFLGVTTYNESSHIALRIRPRHTWHLSCFNRHDRHTTRRTTCRPCPSVLVHLTSVHWFAGSSVGTLP